MTDDKKKIAAACKIVGCKQKDLLASRIAGEFVILIVGPVGFKKKVPFSDLGAPEPVTTQVEADTPPVTASSKRTRTRGSAKKA